VFFLALLGTVSAATLGLMRCRRLLYLSSTVIQEGLLNIAMLDTVIDRETAEKEGQNK